MSKDSRPMLENATEEKKPTLGLVKDEPATPEAPAKNGGLRLLDEVESLKVEVMNLSNQNFQLEEQLMKSRVALLEAQQANMRLRQENYKKSQEKILDDLGLTGAKMTLSKNKDGRYEVKTEAAP